VTEAASKRVVRPNMEISCLADGTASRADQRPRLRTTTGSAVSSEPP
jgi:hypothetical protein